MSISKTFGSKIQPPDFVKQFSDKVAEEDENQYTLTDGHPLLRQSIASLYSSKLFGENQRQIDEINEVMVCTEMKTVFNGIFSAFLNKGDEVVCLQCYSHKYKPQIELLGAKLLTYDIQINAQEIEPRVHQPQHELRLELNFQQIKNLLNDKTKFVIVNNPIAKFGKLLDLNQLENFRRILAEFPKICVIAEEVWEHTEYDDNKPITRLATLEGMWDKTISIYSSNKLFMWNGSDTTHFIGPEHLIKFVGGYLQCMTYGANCPAQKTFYYCYKQSMNSYNNCGNYWQWLNQLYRKKNSRLFDILYKYKYAFRWQVCKPECGKYIIVDITNSLHMIPIKYFYKDFNEKTCSLGDEKGNERLEKFEDWLKLSEPDFTPDLAFC